MIMKLNTKKVGSVVGICVGVITICGAVVTGLGNYYGIPEIKSKVNIIQKEQQVIVKTVSEIKGMLKYEKHQAEYPIWKSSTNDYGYGDAWFYNTNVNNGL